ARFSRDWSSDVCSSDLCAEHEGSAITGCAAAAVVVAAARRHSQDQPTGDRSGDQPALQASATHLTPHKFDCRVVIRPVECDSTADRKSVVEARSGEQGG